MLAGDRQATAEQETVRRWAWQTFGVAVRAATGALPRGVGALTVSDGGPGVAARILYEAACPHWRAHVMRELGALVDVAEAS